MADRGIYTVVFDQVSFTAANGDYDFFDLIPVSNKPIEIVAVKINNLTRIGDAQEDMVPWSIVRGNATVGSGGTAPTPNPIDPSDGAASFTARVADSVIASTGTAVTVVEGAFNVRAGLEEIYPELMRPKASAADTRICVRMLAALPADTTFSGTCWVQEL
jgi:hypothetical protein